MAWMADGLWERLVIYFIGERLRLFWARQMAETREPRSASNAVAVVPRSRVAWSFSARLEKAEAVQMAGSSLSSRLWLALDPRAKMLRWSDLLVRSSIVFAQSFCSSLWRTRWLAVNRG
jgi:hypothetical protein